MLLCINMLKQLNILNTYTCLSQKEKSKPCCDYLPNYTLSHGICFMRSNRQVLLFV
uniref:Uncharacterized protein n=1 Tax=Arundo donax TaxID=35708 RepID=A0A0A9GGX3_ARUDO